MGSKHLVLKEKKETCEVCSMKFLSLAGMISHQNAKHPEFRSRVLAQKKNNISSSRLRKRIQPQKDDDVDTDETVIATPSAGKPTSVTEFQCPKCEKIFPINFHAVQHIQKKHSVDEEGNKISSSDMLLPLPIEKCTKCHRHFDADTIHKCLGPENSPYNLFYCLGCNCSFMNLVAFHKHVVQVHHDNMDNMFFKTGEEFEMWKKRMESIVKMKYLTLNKGMSYRYFTCNYVSTKNTFSTTYLCPSLIMVRNLETGFQIHYNKTHCEHTCPKYVVPHEFSQYIVTHKDIGTLIKKNEAEDTQQDLYKKYQKIMENIKRDAIRVDVSLLKKLYDSAIKMQALINSSDDEHNAKDEIPLFEEVSLMGNHDFEDEASFNKSMTDDQISNILENKRKSVRLKRKSETDSVEAKKAKVNVITKMKPKTDKVVLKENKECESPKGGAKPATTMSPSFNDTYKQFIGTNETGDTNKSKFTKRKEVVKTKIGQFSPKKKSPNLDENADKTRGSPNILKPSIINTKEVKYEVREQENDCNILVLKI